ncbi:MAG: hypothetical protein DYG85_17080 [Chloroflexi bacterium CFX1]|nr:hypothetical protein [Chloroflexi bacterium CFX1]MCQ3954264.1 hypothetical protein [Chloroflexota bacterium]MDL1919908.1 hypothetical protein [Chloroflexi bacterium CFX5]NUQ58826.1 hypothetical protein [Anaerolineales bacterium]
MNTNPYRLAGWSATLSAIATILGAITLVIFFSVGDPYGKINDVCSIVIGLTAILILFTLYQIHRASAPTASLIAFSIGAVAMLIGAALQTLLVITGANFGDLVTFVFGVYGASLVTFHWLAKSSGTLPRGLSWMGIAAGLGYVLVTAGFILGGPNHLLTYIGGALSVIAYPVWGFWLGRMWLSAR